MAVVRWGPIGDLITIQERMNRMFDEAFRSSPEKGGDEWVLGGSWAPAVDIYEQDGSIVLTAELPGVDPSKVDIRLENNVLTLSGERRMSEEVSKDHFHRVERSYGAFNRSFTLPSVVNQEQIQAEYKDGILRVRLPRREETRPRQISISVGK